jgi:hypothetical protein
MFSRIWNLIKGKLTYMQFQTLITSITAILLVIQDYYGITFIGVDKIEILAGAVWAILTVFGVTAKLSDMHNDVKPEETPKNFFK